MTTEEFQEYSKNKTKETYHFVSDKFMPNGIYRLMFQLYNDNDTVGLTLNWQYEIYYRLNDEKI